MLHYKSVHVSVFLTYILVSYARIVPSSLLEKGYTVIHAPQRSVNFSKCYSIILNAIDSVLTSTGMGRTLYNLVKGPLEN